MRILAQKAQLVLSKLRPSLPIVVLVAILTTAVYWIMEVRPPDPFEPMELVELRISPETLTVGQEATLYNGVCVDSEGPLVAQVFMGVEVVGGDPVLEGDVIPVVGESDTENGRKRRTFSPGCIETDPIPFVVPEFLPEGRLRLYLHIIITSGDDRQELVERSNEFTVIK